MFQQILVTSNPFVFVARNWDRGASYIYTILLSLVPVTSYCCPLFILASNAGSELFMSINDDPKTKTMITYVDGGFPTGQYEYDRQD